MSSGIRPAEAVSRPGTAAWRWSGAAAACAQLRADMCVHEQTSDGEGDVQTCCDRTPSTVGLSSGDAGQNPQTGTSTRSSGTGGESRLSGEVMALEFAL